MGLFNKIFNKNQDDQTSMQNNPESLTENIDGISLIDKHEKGLLDDSFLSSFGNDNVFYSTPFGDHKDGNSQMLEIY